MTLQSDTFSCGCSHSQANTVEAPNCLHSLTQQYVKVTFPLASIMFHVHIHTIHFLDGMNLTGGIPLVEQVDHLVMLGITAGSLLVEG